MGIIYNEGIDFLGSKKDTQVNLKKDIENASWFEPIIQNGKNVYYISQDNFYFADLTTGTDTIYYCDSATSCIVIIVTGYSEGDKKEMMAISHLSRPGRFENFFQLVEEKFGANEVCVYASGANPPQPCEKSDGTFDYTALRNATQVSKWVSSGRITVKQVNLRFGEGNPSIFTNNLDCFSLSYGANSGIEVTNRRLYLTDEDRDSTGGVQTLFCMFGDQSKIRLQSEPFTDEEIKNLVGIAKSKNLQEAATMSDDEILKRYSSTPDYEVPWFCSTIREAGVFTQNYQG